MSTIPSSKPLLTELLSEVSRSFYLTLRVLPGAIRGQIGLAYLLARAADTIADTELVSVKRRLQALDDLSRRIRGESNVPLAFGELAKVAGQSRIAGQGSASERILLERVGEAVGLIESFSPDDQARIRKVLDTITGGQVLDLQRFGQADGKNIVSLTTDEELDDYTYRVAGCVGEFWTWMCRAHLFPAVSLDEGALLRRGVRFGKGLQLVNILRDLPSDLRNGRCYLPSQGLKTLGLDPSDLLDHAKESQARPSIDAWLNRAWEYLREGWDYTCSLPGQCVRVRLACAWPVLIGVRTLDHLRESSVLDPSVRIKVSRAEVKGILWGSLWRLPIPFLWERQFPARRKSNST